MSSRTIITRTKEHFYPEDAQDALDAAFIQYARAGMAVLDAGCGGKRGCSSSAPTDRMRIVGIDADESVHENPFCDETRVCDLSERLPFADESYDLIHCRWVLEHLEKPEHTFREFRRVLRPGGRLLAVTPNLFHYATMVARTTPYTFHRSWCRGPEQEVFPTYYRANTLKALRRLCRRVGFSIEQLETNEVYPYYLENHILLFLGGILYERIVNSSDLLQSFRQRILLVACRPKDS